MSEHDPMDKSGFVDRYGAFVQCGDWVFHTLDRIVGKVAEIQQDGFATLLREDGTYGVARWNHLYKVSEPKEPPKSCDPCFYPTLPPGTYTITPYHKVADKVLYEVTEGAYAGTKIWIPAQDFRITIAVEEFSNEQEE